MDDAREYGPNQGYRSPHLPKVNDVNCTQSRIDGKYVEDADDEEEEEEEQDETNVLNETAHQNGDDDDDDENDQYDDDDDDDDDEDGGDDHERKRNDNVNQHRHPKKRKLSLLSSYEFAPRVPPPTSARKPSFGGRNTLTDWSEHETFVLLDAWGDRFIKCGRKSLRSEEWLEVADRVSQESKIERTDSQCRNRLDTLKKKYKKEKASLNGSRIINPKWVYFKKMDMLLSSGGNAVVNPSSANLNHINAVGETKGASANSYSHNDDDDDVDDDSDSDSDLLPPKKSKPADSFKSLADSINKFSEIYEKIENNKIQQMIELEKMKMEFHKDLELQKRQILERAQAEISKLQQGDYEDNDVSAENISG